MRGILMAKKWYPEIWKPLDIKLDIPKNYFSPSEPNSFYASKKPNEGYEVYGINPTSKKTDNPERTSY